MSEKSDESASNMSSMKNASNNYGSIISSENSNNSKNNQKAQLSRKMQSQGFKDNKVAFSGVQRHPSEPEERLKMQSIKVAGPRYYKPKAQGDL